MSGGFRRRGVDSTILRRIGGRRRRLMDAALRRECWTPPKGGTPERGASERGGPVRTAAALGRIEWTVGIGDGCGEWVI